MSQSAAKCLKLQHVDVKLLTVFTSLLSIPSTSYVWHSISPCGSFRPCSDVAQFLKKMGAKGVGQGEGPWAAQDWLPYAMLIQNLQKCRWKMLEGRKGFLSLSFLALLSQPELWVRHWDQKLGCSSQPSVDFLRCPPSTSIGLIPVGVALTRSPGDYALTHLLPRLASESDSHSLHLRLCVSYITWKTKKESWLVFIWMTQNKENSSSRSHTQMLFFRHISKCLRFDYIMVKEGISIGRIILLVYRYMHTGK